MNPQDCLLRCHYCRFCEEFKAVIKHCIESHRKVEIDLRQKFLCDQRGDIKYQVLNFGLIPDTLNPISNITIDINNWSVKGRKGDGRRESGIPFPPFKLAPIRLDTLLIIRYSM